MSALDGILESYLTRVDRGESPDRHCYFREYPEFASELEKFFENLDFVDAQVKEMQGDAADVPVIPPGSSNGRDSSVQHGTVPMVTELLGGPTIHGYRLLMELGRGSQGVVYKAEQLGTKRLVALKVVREGLFASSEERRRFESEIQLASRLSHPNILSIYHCGNDRGFLYYAMEYVDGQPLDNFLRFKTLDIRPTLEVFVQICAAVAYAHQRGVIHRDLKPSNILIDQSGVIHVLDFGLAKSIPGSGSAPTAAVTEVGQFTGTWYYASPEQAARDPDLVDVRTDVYALGVVLFEMLTDCYPYPVVGEPPEAVARTIRETAPHRASSRRPEIDDELDTIVDCALRKDPDVRYQTVAAFADDIQRYLAGEPIAAKRDSRWYLLRATTRRYRWYIAGAGVGFAAVAVLAFIYATLYWRAAAAQATAELRASLDRRMQVDLLRQLDDLNVLTNRYDASVERRRHSGDMLVDSRPPFSGSLAAWAMLAAQAPSDVVQKTLAMDDTAIAWLASQATHFQAALGVISSFKMTPLDRRHSEWEFLNPPDAVGEAQQLVEVLIALGVLEFRRGDAASTVNYLDAARQYALDLGDGCALFHKSTANRLRTQLYDVLLMILSSGLTQKLDDGLLDWMLRDPPLVGYRLSLTAEAIKLGQLWEAATFATSSGDSYVAMSRLDELTDGYYSSMDLSNFPLRPSAFRLQDITAEFFREIRQWDDLSLVVLREHEGALRQRMQSAVEWPVVRAMVPAIGQTLRMRAIAGAKRRALILATVVLDYRRDTGQWPSNAEEMRSFVPVDTTDTYSGMPLSYRLIDGTPVIYSLNADLVDDAARPGSWDESGTDVILFPIGAQKVGAAEDAASKPTPSATHEHG